MYPPPSGININPHFPTIDDRIHRKQRSDGGAGGENKQHFRFLTSFCNQRCQVGSAGYPYHQESAYTLPSAVIAPPTATLAAPSTWHIPLHVPHGLPIMATIGVGRNHQQGEFSMPGPLAHWRYNAGPRLAPRAGAKPSQPWHVLPWAWMPWEGPVFRSSASCFNATVATLHDT